MAHIEVQGDKLIITVDLNTKPVLSPSGKTHGIDSSHGFQAFSTPFGAAMVSLNVATKDPKYIAHVPGKATAAAPTVKRQ